MKKKPETTGIGDVTQAVAFLNSNGLYFTKPSTSLYCATCHKVTKPAEPSRVGRWFYVKPYDKDIYLMKCLAELPDGGMIAEGNAGNYEIKADRVLAERRPSFLRRLFSKETR